MSLLTLIIGKEDIKKSCIELNKLIKARCAPAGTTSVVVKGAERRARLYHYHKGQTSLFITIVKSDYASYLYAMEVSKHKEKADLQLHLRLDVSYRSKGAPSPTAFGHDSTGNVYLLQTGRFTGKYTMAREYFLQHYKGMLCYADNPANYENAQMAIIGHFKSKDFFESLAYFASEVERTNAQKPPHPKKLHPAIRARNRALADTAAEQLNKRLKNYGKLFVHEFKRYQRDGSEDASAYIDFIYEGKTLALETTLSRSTLRMEIFPRAPKRDKQAVMDLYSAALAKGLDKPSYPDLKLDVDKSSDRPISCMISLPPYRGQERAIIVDYTEQVTKAIISELRISSSTRRKA